MTTQSLLARSLLLALAASAAACVNVQESTTTLDAPAETTFKPMGDFLIRRCGTLDCHGQIGRNLRLYGEWGIRLNPMDVPGQSPTTMAEYQADYESVIALEPELLSQVVMGQANPQQLRLLGKPMESIMINGELGPMEHKGGLLIMSTMDPQYVCVASWLAQNVNTMACQEATSINP